MRGFVHACQLHNGGSKRDYQPMSPPTEQLIRDYLNRLSVAARGQLGPDDRRALVIRTRDFIERKTGLAGPPTAMEVARLLAGLGDPSGLVQQERQRLAVVRGELSSRPRTGTGSAGFFAVAPPEPAPRAGTGQHKQAAEPICSGRCSQAARPLSMCLPTLRYRRHRRSPPPAPPPPELPPPELPPAELPPPGPAPRTSAQSRTG